MQDLFVIFRQNSFKQEIGNVFEAIVSVQMEETKTRKKLSLAMRI
jgi:hypothetical protein